MKRMTAILLLIVIMAGLCAWSPAAADARQKYSIEENMAENKATYPYLVRTESATWYLCADDIELLGEDAFFQGLYEVLENQDADFADARAALAGFVAEDIEPINIYTDFSGRAGISEMEYVGAYYNERRNFIKVFRGWDITKYALLHEYVHYLTIHCTAAPVAHGLFAEGIADYVSMILCGNRMARDYFRGVSEERKLYFRMHGAWDREEDCVDPRLYEFGMAELYAQGYKLDEEFMTTLDVEIVRTAEIQQNPTAETISHMEAACIMAYLAETYTREVLFAHMDMLPEEMEQVFGEPFGAVYEHWKEWNTEYFNETGMIL